MRPEIEKAKQKLQQMLAKNKINPQTFVQAGRMAEQALKNTALYPMLTQMLIKQGLLEQKDLQQGIDKKFLAYMIAMGKIAELIVQGK
jgi:hypothetical protein